jgi:hypothetical protein
VSASFGLGGQVLAQCFVCSDSNSNTAVGTSALQVNTGEANTAVGAYTLLSNSSGFGNTALGANSLDANTTGQENTGLGLFTLSNNTTGGFNTGVGEGALFDSTTGQNNTATGFWALVTNSTGSNNTAAGYEALGGAYGGGTLQTGSDSSAFGFRALYSNTTGYSSAAVGYQALMSNTTGYYNNAAGYNALVANTTGYNNNAQGSYALSSNTQGYGNTAMGANSLLNLNTGSRNVGVGNNTGTSLVAGDYNVDIGWGVTGSADESGVVRIGNPTYATATYVAGVSGNVVTGAAVYVTASGQLGVLASSERYKTDIAPLASDAAKIDKLRPVTFHLKTDSDGALQYGLIAEEVDMIYPELVIHDQAGQIQGVRYDELAPILLSEVQQQRQELSDARAQIAAQTEKFAVLERQVEQVQEINRAMQASLSKLQDADSRVAMH